MSSETSHPSVASSDRPPRIAVITCAVLELEIEHYRRSIPQVVHVEILKQGLHNEPDRLRLELQEAINKVEDLGGIDAIVLGYGLCSRGTEGVFTRNAKLVIARAHDCITHLLGSKERYAEYVAKHPGTYWYSPGWNKHHTPPGPERHRKLYAKYLEQFGKEDADFLMESEQHWFQTYSQATYVDLGVGATDEDLKYTQDCASWLKWNYDHQHGDPQLLIDLMAGRWDDERFLVLEPLHALRMTADEKVFESRPVEPAAEQQTSDVH
jgi:hypothetical protein